MNVKQICTHFVVITVLTLVGALLLNAPPSTAAVRPAGPVVPTGMVLSAGQNRATPTSDLLDVSTDTDKASAHFLEDPTTTDQSTWRTLYTQAGRPRAWPTTPVRWDPCTPITWIFDNPSRAEDQPNARKAISQISHATGMTFVEVGKKQTANIHIKFVDFRTVFPSFRGAFGAADVSPTKPSKNTWWAYKKATVYLNSWRFHQNDQYKVMLFEGRARKDALYFQTRKHRQHTILHELGHVVGLHHTNWWAPANRTSVMATGVDSTTFTPGDLAGLRTVGKKAGCHSAPEPVKVAAGTPAPSRTTTAVQILVPTNPERTYTSTYLCDNTGCAQGSRGPNPNAPGVATWLFTARCTLAPRTLKVVTESRYHTRTVTSTVRAGCPPAPPQVPKSTGWARNGTATQFGWASSSDAADVDGYIYRISAPNNSTALPTTWSSRTEAVALLSAAQPGAAYTVEAQAHNVFGYSNTAKMTYITTVAPKTVFPIKTGVANNRGVGKISLNAKEGGTLRVYPCSVGKNGETLTYPKGTTVLNVNTLADKFGNICITASSELVSLAYAHLSGAGTWTVVKQANVTTTTAAKVTKTLTGGVKKASIRVKLTVVAPTSGTMVVNNCATGQTGQSIAYSKGSTSVDLITATGSGGTWCVKTSGATKLTSAVVGRGTLVGVVSTRLDTANPRR